jgi:hypothetical protein
MNEENKPPTAAPLHGIVLLPCPFCGSTELNGPHISEYVGDHYSPSWWVECENCPGSMEVQGAGADGLANAWNKRTDKEDAEKYRALMKSLGSMSTVHPPIWDSRNIGQ